MISIIILLVIIGLVWILLFRPKLDKKSYYKILEAYLVLLVIIIPQLISFFYFPLPQGRFDYAIIFCGIILAGIGLFIDIWSRSTMGKLWGPPGQHDQQRQTTLITSGPFKYSRNPIYLGTFFLLIGLSLILKSIFFFLPLIHIWYFNKQIKSEEKLLQEKFGKEYLKYKSKTPRFI